MIPIIQVEEKSLMFEDEIPAVASTQTLKMEQEEK